MTLVEQIRAMRLQLSSEFNNGWNAAIKRAATLTEQHEADTETRINAAVAAAYERAAQTVDTLGDSAVTEALGARLCCDGHMCGCQGADVGAYILHHIRALATHPETDALAEVVNAAVKKATAKPRIVMIGINAGVCVGGRWDGWMMIKHPDGNWVSDRKLDAVDPADGSGVLSKLFQIGGDA